MAKIELQVIKSDLESIFYWMIEIEKDCNTGYFASIHGANCITERMHEIAIMKERLKDEDLDWEQLCSEAKEAALIRWEEDNKEFSEK